MKILIFHGYLLQGTGSNVYNESLARALKRLGHKVHLLCQDREAPSLQWVDAVGRWTDGELELEGSVPADGSVTVYLPDIGGLLPVFVPDEYEGFEVKTFAELTDAELDRYLEANVKAVEDVLALVGGVDAALANHLVMGPVILSRAGLEFALKVHGSDLSYTVLPDLDRFRPYAEEATAAAAGILVGSRHIAERLALAVDDPDVTAKVHLGPPGVDTSLFSPLEPADRPRRLAELAVTLREEALSPGGAWERDNAAAADALDWLAGIGGPRVVFVGKLIVSKGVDLLLAAWPLVHAANPGAGLLIVGFGEYEAGLRRLWDALQRGDLDDARKVATAGWGLEGGEERPLKMLTSFLDVHPASYPDAADPASYPAAALAAAGSVEFAGRLEHDEVGRLVPACDALVFPSTFPEAFGMVAAEAAAAGDLPVSAAHSGAAEVSRSLAAALPAEARDLVSFPLDDGAVRAIADRLNRWLALDGGTREETRSALVETARSLWSWEGVAESVIAASEGRLDDLTPVPDD
jgi:glycosyltransferase involved in cell wall biosynthesis